MLCDKCGASLKNRMKCTICFFDNSDVDFRPVDIDALYEELAAREDALATNLMAGVAFGLGSPVIVTKHRIPGDLGKRKGEEKGARDEEGRFIDKDEMVHPGAKEYYAGIAIICAAVALPIVNAVIFNSLVLALCSLMPAIPLFAAGQQLLRSVTITAEEKRALRRQYALLKIPFPDQGVEWKTKNKYQGLIIFGAMAFVLQTFVLLIWIFAVIPAASQ
jgi:hypothetical protein